LFRKIFSTMLIIILLSAGGLGIKKILTPKPETVKITLAQPEQSPGMIPHYLARKKNFFREQLAEVKIKTYPGDETPQEALARGEADIIVMGLADFLYSKCWNADLVAFAAVTAGEPSFIMAREEMPEFKWQDMKDKSIIGDPPESTAGVLLEAVLRKHEMAPYRNVTVFYNIPEDLKGGVFKAGSSTFLQASEPLVSRLESEGTARVVGSLASEKIPAMVYVTSGKKLARHPEKIQRFTNGIYKALLWMKYHGDIAGRDLAPEFKNMDRALMEGAVKRYLKAKIWPESPLVDKQSVKEFHDMMLNAGELPRSFACSQALNDKLVKRALETVEYIPPEQQKKGLKKFWPF